MHHGGKWRSWGRYESAGRCVRVALLLFAVAAITMLLAVRAHADPPAPTPTLSPSAGPSASPSASPPPAAGSAQKRDSPYSVSKEDAKERAAHEDRRKKLEKSVAIYKKQHGGGGVISAFQVTDKYDIPITAYTVASDSGGLMDVQLKLASASTEFIFTITKWMIAIGCWMISWALSWSLAAIMLKPAMAVSDALYRQTIVQLGVPGVLIAFSGTVTVWHIFFGNRARGWGEITASTLIAALSISVFAAPPQMLLSPNDGAVGKARQLGVVVFALVLDAEDSVPKSGELGADAAKKLTRPITDKLVDSFIVQPSMLLSYDQTFSDKCAETYSISRVQKAVFDEAVHKKVKEITKNPLDFSLQFGAQRDLDEMIIDKATQLVIDQVYDDDPTTWFEKQCVKGDAGGAKRASWDKAGGAFFVFLASVLVFFLLLATGFSYLVTQLRLAIEAMLLRVALTAGIMPGPGRAWLWERATTILRLLGMLVTVVVALAITVVIITGVLGAKPNDIPGGLTVRFIVVDIVVVAGFVFRRRIATKSRAMAAQARTRLGNTRFGGTAPTQQEPSRRRRHSIASTALMLGALAATGGTSSALALGGRGASSLGLRLGARTLRRGGRALAHGTGRMLNGSVRTAGRVGKFGIKYTLGAPVHIPRTAKAAKAALHSAPGRVTRSAADLQTRLSQAATPRLAAAADYGSEWWSNMGGRWAHNRIRLHRGLPPLPTPRHQRPAPRPTAPRPAAARPTRRPPRRVPARPVQPAASARQASLQQRLHRMRINNQPPPAPAPPPAAPPTSPRRGAPPRRTTPPRARRPRGSSGGRP